MASTLYSSKESAKCKDKNISIPTTHKLIIGDARRVRTTEIGPIHLVVTSPPYFTIKDYGSKNQIGYRQTLKEYIDSLLVVWRKCYNTLLPGCRMAINIGDQYLRSSKGNPYQIMPLHASIVNSIMSDKKMKFLFLGSIVWRKISTTRTTGGASVMGSYPFPRSVYPCFENEFIALFRKDGKPYPASTEENKELARMSIDEWRDVTSGIWQFPGTKMKENPAAFPEELPARLIQMFTFPGEMVLDPFVGSGTTMRASAAMGRNSIGIDIGFKTLSDRPFEEIVKENIETVNRVEYAGIPKIEIFRK